jgi:hypothetical protein
VYTVLLIKYYYMYPSYALLSTDVGVYYNMELTITTLAKGAISVKWWGFARHRLDRVCLQTSDTTVFILTG